ncbi:ethanolaminephosphotransferase 1 [Manduca sexta]|uniref:ethanolaminephosphotransferase 1 n=1 Tax=Manduca sexta TaxID=7130 RepID=UPI00188F63FA|nr:ethanolaminephosphotransferase 1 [Manduca sexta]XP_037297837.1 ethanolaminephosphotransferase 1 [Manduca sexta]
MFSYKYLSKQHLQGFNKYKYSAIDTSPLSNYVMHPTWNFITKFIPKWIAPNVITFAGFLCMVAAVVLLTVYDYDWRASVRWTERQTEYGIPGWAFTTCGVLIFLAYNLDGLDGKQARRLGVSGPLGELFDHGLDSYIVFLIPYAVISIFGRDPVYSVVCFRGFLMVMSIVINFYISHWEKYNTGTLYLPWGYDISMWVTSMIFIIAGVYGPDAFKFYLFGDVTFAVSFETLAHCIGLFTTLPVAVYNVYLSRKNRTGKKHTLMGALKPIWSLLTIIVIMMTWGLKSHNDIVEYDPRAFIALFGTLFSNIASRLMIAGMCHQKCDTLHWFTWPLLAGVGLSLYLPSVERTVLYTLFILSVLAHVHYGVCVVRQICDHFRISCFTVPKNKLK